MFNPGNVFVLTIIDTCLCIVPVSLLLSAEMSQHWYDVNFGIIVQPPCFTAVSNIQIFYFAVERSSFQV